MCDGIELMRTCPSSSYFIFFHPSWFQNNFYLDLILQQGRDITPCSRQCTCSHMLTLLLASVFVDDGFLLFTSVHESTSGFFAPTNFSNFNFLEKETGMTAWQGSPWTEQSLLLFPSWARTTKGGSAWIMSNLWGRRNPNFRTSQSCSLSSNWFFWVRASVYWSKLLVITEPTVASRQLLGLGSKVHVYTSNTLQMFNRSYSIHAESFSSTLKSRKWKEGSASRAVTKISNCPIYATSRQ